MRICQVITRLIVGGAQENTLLTCEGLHRRGHEVLLLAGPETGPEGSLQERAKAGGYPVELVNPLRRAVRPRLDWICRRELARRFRAWRPDVVHTHSSKAGILGRLAARDAGVPFVVHTLHGMSFNRTQSALTRWVFKTAERRCARLTDRIISVADAMTSQCLANGVGRREQYCTIYSGMEVDRYDPSRFDRESVRRAWGLNERDIVVGTIARLFENKGYEQLIAAMPEAVAREASLRFVWIGGGSYRDRYEAELRRTGMADRVVMTGLVPPERIPELLSGMDMLVHASQWEGLPRTVVQAMLMERPAISFDIDGAPEVVIPGRTGELVPLNDVRGLADAIVGLAKDPNRRRRYGKAGRALCLSQFDHRRMVELIEGVYASRIA
jgi:glycosyltransferase involved in cell wall biosynthesis